MLRTYRYKINTICFNNDYGLITYKVVCLNILSRMYCRDFKQLFLVILNHSLQNFEGNS